MRACYMQAGPWDGMDARTCIHKHRNACLVRSKEKTGWCLRMTALKCCVADFTASGPVGGSHGTWVGRAGYNMLARGKAKGLFFVTKPQKGHGQAVQPFFAETVSETLTLLSHTCTT